MKTITYKPRKSGKTHAHNQIVNAQLRDMVNQIPIKLHVVKRPNDADIDRLKHIIYEAETHNERYQLPLTNNVDLIYQDEPLLQDVDYIKMREEWEDKTKEAINKGYQFHLSVDPYIADAELMVFKSLIDNSSNNYNIIKYPVIQDLIPKDMEVKGDLYGMPQSKITKDEMDKAINLYNRQYGLLEYRSDDNEYAHLYTSQTCTRTSDVVIDVKPNNWFYKLMNKLFNLE